MDSVEFEGPFLSLPLPLYSCAFIWLCICRICRRWRWAARAMAAFDNVRKFAIRGLTNYLLMMVGVSYILFFVRVCVFCFMFYSCLLFKMISKENIIFTLCWKPRFIFNMLVVAFAGALSKAIWGNRFNALTRIWPFLVSGIVKVFQVTKMAVSV